MRSPIIFLSILAFVLFLLDIYFWQAVRVNISERTKYYGIVRSFYWILSLLSTFLLLYTFSRYQDRPSLSWVTTIRGITMGVFIAKLLGIAPLLIDDIFRLFRWIATLFSSPILPNDGNGNGISRLNFLKNTAIGIGGIIFSAMSYGVLVGRYNFKKHYVDLKLKNLSPSLKGLKIIQISDLHLGSFTSAEPIDHAVQMINEEKADLIVFTGDLVNYFAQEAEPFIQSLSKLKAKHGKFSILGNHDYADYSAFRKGTTEYEKQWTKNRKRMLQIHKEMGFHLLLDENRLIEIEGGKMNLLGIENWGAGFSQYGDLEKTMEGVDHSLPSILLSHDPSHWNEQVRTHKEFIDVQLAGHTHGMQFGVELGGFQWSPVQWKYPQWAGLYQNGEHQLYVNRGLGHVAYPGRVGIMPEITVIELS